MHPSSQSLLFKVLLSLTDVLSEFGDPFQENLPDISQFSSEHNIDPPHPYFSEVLVFFTPLCELDYLCDPYIAWGSEEHRRRIEEQDSRPLRFVSSCELEQDITAIAMFTLDDEPWLTFVVREHYIVFFRCGHQQTIALECTENVNFRFQVSIDSSRPQNIESDTPPSMSERFSPSQDRDKSSSFASVLPSQSKNG